MHIRIWLVLLLWALVAPAQAAQQHLPLWAAALTHGGVSQVQGCGVRVTGGHAALKAKSVWLDLSFNVYTSGVALVQAIAYEMPPSTYENESRPRRVAVQRAWVRLRNGTGSTRLGENTMARDTLVYAVSLDDATRLFEAIAAAEPLAVGIRGWGEPREWVFEGIAVLTDAARAEIAACFSALVN